MRGSLLVSRWRHKSLRQSPSSSPRPFSHSTVRAFAGVQTFSGPSLTCSFIPEPMQNAFHKAGMLVRLIVVLVAPESSLLCYKELQKSHDHIWSAHVSSLAWNNWNHAFIPLVAISGKHPLKGSGYCDRDHKQLDGWSCHSCLCCTSTEVKAGSSRESLPRSHTEETSLLASNSEALHHHVFLACHVQSTSKQRRSLICTRWSVEWLKWPLQLTKSRKM